MKEMSFEAAFTELEEIVQQMESGELSLDDTIDLFERGQLLAGQCQEQLDQAELRITQLVDGVSGAL
jgi:exodeoxyribonuclease VII small subunit